MIAMGLKDNLYAVGRGSDNELSQRSLPLWMKMCLWIFQKKERATLCRQASDNNWKGVGKTKSYVSRSNPSITLIYAGPADITILQSNIVSSMKFFNIHSNSGAKLLQPPRNLIFQKSRGCNFLNYVLRNMESKISCLPPFRNHKSTRIFPQQVLNNILSPWPEITDIQVGF